MFNFFKKEKKYVVSVYYDNYLEITFEEKSSDRLKNIDCLNFAYAEIIKGKVDLTTLVINTVKDIGPFQYQKEAQKSITEYRFADEKNLYIETNTFFTEIFQTKKAVKNLKLLEPFMVKAIEEKAQEENWNPPLKKGIKSILVVSDEGFKLAFANGKSADDKLIKSKTKPTRDIKNTFTNVDIGKYVNYGDLYKYYSDPANFSYLAAVSGAYSFADLKTPIKPTFDDAVAFYKSALMKELY